MLQLAAPRQSTSQVEPKSQLVVQLLAPLQSTSHELSLWHPVVQLPPVQPVNAQVAPQLQLFWQLLEPLHEVEQTEKKPTQLLLQDAVASQPSAQSPSLQLAVHEPALVQSMLQSA